MCVCVCIYVFTKMTPLFIYMYIYILSSTDRSVSLYQNSSVWLDRIDSWSWDRNPVDSNANPRFYHSATRKPVKAKKFKRLWITIVFVYIYPLNGYWELDSQWRALHIHKWQHNYIYICIYIYIYKCKVSKKEKVSLKILFKNIFKIFMSEL